MARSLHELAIDDNFAAFEKQWAIDNKIRGQLSTQQATNCARTFASLKNTPLNYGGGGGGGGGTTPQSPTPSGAGNFFSKGNLSFADLFKDYIKSQEIGIGSSTKYFKDTYADSDAIASLLKEGLSFGNLIQASVSSVNDYYNDQTALLDLVNRKTGLTGKLSEDWRANITEASISLIEYGYTIDDVSDAAVSLVNSTGRFNLLNKDSLITAGQIAKAYVGSLDTLVEMYPEFEKIGLGSDDATKAIQRVGKSSLSVGLQAQKTTKDLSYNLEKLNQYGFKNGVDGLAKMVQKANEFRISMDSVFQIADKVLSPEGAIELSANLAVLGGAIGDFNDPLKLMYEATNNVEGLQDALIGAAKTLTTFNTEQGRFEITGANLRRAKALASELGVSYDELSKGAIAAAQRASIADSLFAKGLTLTDEQQEFISNIAQVKDGKLSIALQTKELQDAFGKSTIAVDELTDSTVSQLLKYQDQFKELSEGDIIRNQATNIENIERQLNVLLSTIRAEAGQTGRAAFDKAANDFGVNIDNLIKEISDSRKTTTLNAQVKESPKNVFITEKSKQEIENKVNNALKTNNTNTTTQENTQKMEIVHKHEIRTDSNIGDKVGNYLLQHPTFYNDLANPDNSERRFIK